MAPIPNRHGGYTHNKQHMCGQGASYSPATGEWFVGELADKMVDTLKPALTALKESLRKPTLSTGLNAPLRVVTDVWISDTERRVTVTVEAQDGDTREIDELVSNGIRAGFRELKKDRKSTAKIAINASTKN